MIVSCVSARLSVCLSVCLPVCHSMMTRNGGNGIAVREKWAARRRFAQSHFCLSYGAERGMLMAPNDDANATANDVRTDRGNFRSQLDT